VDRGAIASNGVNGTLATCTDSGICTAATGIQYVPLLLFSNFVYLLAVIIFIIVID
jgi:hypothetical protein